MSRLGWSGLGVLAVCTLLALARCQGTRAATDAAAITALRTQVAALQDTVRRDAATRDSLIAVARATAPRHARDTMAARAAAAAMAEAMADARAIAARDSLTLEEARATIRLLADRADSLLRRVAAERASSTIRIGAQEQVIVHVQVTATRVDSLVAKQTKLAEAALRQRPWYLRLLGEGCTAATTGTGAAGGAAVGGPLGAGVGAVGGYLAGRLSCR